MCGPCVVLFSSPDPKGHARYCHHLASVIIVHKLVHFIFFSESESTGPIGTKLGRNVHWIVPMKIYVFFVGQKDTTETRLNGVKKGVSIYMGINYL